MIKPKQILFVMVPSEVPTDYNIKQMWDAMLADELDKAVMEIGGIVVTMERKQPSTLARK